MLKVLLLILSAVSLCVYALNYEPTYHFNHNYLNTGEEQKEKKEDQEQVVLVASNPKRQTVKVDRHCNRCDGQGFTMCMGCNGTGKCQLCNGVGYVEKVTTLYNDKYGNAKKENSLNRKKSKTGLTQDNTGIRNIKSKSFCSAYCKDCKGKGWFVCDRCHNENKMKCPKKLK